MIRPAASYRIGAFRLDAAAYQLSAGGTPLPISPKALDLLFLFAARPGALLTKDDILGELWPDVAVTDNALTQVVSEIRQALGDVPATPTFVQTVARRGYRFVAAVERLGDDPPTSTPSRPAVPAIDRTSRTLVVIDFTNLTRDPDLDWLSAGMAETVANGLRAVSDLSVIDRVKTAGTPDGQSTAAGVDIVISGAFQRAGRQMRLTAQAIETRAGRALAQAKADGPFDEIFRLEDAIVAQLVSGLELTAAPPARARAHARETSSLEAYRALTEGRLKLETMDRDAVVPAVADFERALRLDPSYALAHVGLAHARFWIFQASRLGHHADRAALAAAIAHARTAIEIDAELAEAHAALALCLSAAGRSREAVAAGRLATALEPANWRHQFRLGVAAWADERLRCFEAVLSVFPQLGHAHFGTAMVHVARRDLSEAERVLRVGIAATVRGSDDVRFPANGLHWLLGLIRLASGDSTEAVREFDRELARPRRAIFAEEYVMDAYDAHGGAQLAAGDARGAIEMFARALDGFPDHARSLVGLAAACRQAGEIDRANRADEQAQRAIAELAAQDRLAEGTLALAGMAALAGRHGDALASLDRLLTAAPPGYAGWTIPVEPFLAGLVGQSGFDAIVTKLAARAS